MLLSVPLSKEACGLAVALFVLALEGHLSPEVVGGRQNPRMVWGGSQVTTLSPPCTISTSTPIEGVAAAC